MTWRAIPDFVGVYEITADGQIRSVDRVGEYRHRRMRGRPIRTHLDRAGYRYVQLNHAGAYRFAFVHRLVAAAFIGPAAAGMQVNHINGRKDDNRVENLEYVTPSENMLHRSRVLGVGRGDGHGKAKLRSSQIPMIRLLCSRGDRPSEIARLIGVSRCAIDNVLTGRTWSHVTEKATA